MKQEGLKYFTELHLTTIGLLIFFFFFVGVLLWVYRKQSSDLYKRLEQLPLAADGENHGGR